MSKNHSLLTLLPPSPYLPLSGRSGKLPFTLTNDCMFKIIFQTDEDILCALLCSLLDLKPSDIHSITITNPFVPGTVIQDKDTILDIRLILNDDRLINLEMQMKNEGNWPERSLCYLCRAFDNLEKGAPYSDVTPAHHIGILNFSLPHMQKQFYSHYYMTNETTQEIFSDKLRLSVLNLTQTALATEHDRQSGLTRWAAAFKATTWEEYQMLAEEDSLYQKISDALYLISENREIAEQCRRMQEAEARRKRWEKLEKDYSALEDAVSEQKSVLAEQKNVISEQKNVISEQENVISKQVNLISEQESVISEQESVISEQKSVISEKENVISEKESVISEKESVIAEKEAELEQLKAQLRAYQEQNLPK